MPKVAIVSNPFLEYAALSNSFITNYLPKANGIFVKIYLYTIYCCSQGHNCLSTKVIAEDLNVLECDVINALEYWENEKLLITNKNVTVSKNKINHNTKNKKVSTLKSNKYEKRPNYTPEELAFYCHNQEIKNMFLIAQQYLHKSLSQSELSILYSFYDWLRLPTEVIELLLEYCISNNKYSMKSIEKVALTWYEQEINTIQKAKNEILIFNKKYTSIMNAFGISNRELTPIEINYLKKWFDEYKMDLELIIESCNRTVINTSKASFKYADSILKNWYDSKIFNIDDVRLIDQL